MLGPIFITSPFNDIGDTDGDKKAGRRTLPIALETGIRSSLPYLFLLA
jgi:1,4-dihydroxy-2-naphthoate octaprenyltransferase